MSDEALFGYWLQQCRKSMRLTQQQLASLVECSVATIRKVEADERRPSSRIAKRLAEALVIPAAERETFLRFARGGWSDDPPASPAASPSLLPWSRDGRAPGSVPLPLTELLGREPDLQAALGLLRRGDVRLVTLTGPGGIGKTHLALEVARRIQPDFPYGAHCAMLAPLQDPERLPSTIAQVFGVQESGGYPLWERIKDYLQGKRLLLLLDNFEQIISAAPLVSDLLRTCGDVKVMVTSREVLRLPGEHEVSVPPLAAPSVDSRMDYDARQAATYPAVQLFVQRAREARPEFRLTAENASAVVEVCSRLDGLPLAIELAAARIRLLSPEAMLSRLTRSLDLLTSGARDAPDRQKTMRQAISWSYELLDDEERRLFRHYSVFSGGFTLDAAEAVGQPAENLLDTVNSLIEKSLVRQSSAEEPRYTMLETIREYGLERLAEHGEEWPVRHRHADYFADLMARIEPHLHGPEQAKWMTLARREHSNIRSALLWCMILGELGTALRLAGASWWYWYVQGHVTEGRQLLTELLTRSRGSGSPLLPAALIGAARLAVRQNDDAQAEALYAEAVESSRSLNDEESLVHSLQGRARVASHRGEYDQARRYAEEALLIAKTSGRQRETGICLNELGEIARSEAKYDEAVSLYEEGLRILSAVGDKVPMVSVLANLGHMAAKKGDLTGSVTHFRQGLLLAQSVGDVLGIATSLAGLAGVATLSGDARGAARLFGASDAVHRAGAVLPDPVDQGDVDEHITHSRRELPAEEWESAFSEGKRITVEAAIRAALEVSRATVDLDEAAG